MGLDIKAVDVAWCQTPILMGVVLFWSLGNFESSGHLRATTRTLNCGVHGLSAATACSGVTAPQWRIFQNVVWTSEVAETEQREKPWKLWKKNMIVVVLDWG